MKATIQTRIFLALTVDEARAAVTQATDMQLAIRSTLFEIDGIPVSEMMAPSPKQIAAPKKNGQLKFARPEGAKSRAPAGKRVSSKKVHRASNPWTCPGCGRELKGKQGSYHHLKFCKAAKSIVPDATSSSSPETASPMDATTVISASGS